MGKNSGFDSGLFDEKRWRRFVEQERAGGGGSRRSRDREAGVTADRYMEGSSRGTDSLTVQIADSNGDSGGERCEEGFLLYGQNEHQRFHL
eukprot:CAMPEP_0171324584 /NCGR_PEP_ID=MMETSP0816-20121228/116279_1 /TAXON_ID=420281 /ORGANISM="Proboscia inermis, Strain CCAP1064/1" /LENGTH=90 /DNA_ID=CAMNT_0011823553 /DNA_START=264 /DNA_END=536 /DNA_ORIENTATION=+